MRKWVYLTALLLPVVSVGCVERAFVVETNPPGAVVLLNNKPLGSTPADGTWTYYGKYHFTFLLDGYETTHVEQDIPAPWYGYFPIDFFAENLWPFKIVDRRRFRFDLSPERVPDVNEVKGRADNLRNHGRSLRSETGVAPAIPLPPPIP